MVGVETSPQLSYNAGRLSETDLWIVGMPTLIELASYDRIEEEEIGILAVSPLSNFEHFDLLPPLIGVVPLTLQPGSLSRNSKSRQANLRKNLHHRDQLALPDSQLFLMSMELHC
jgi:hypothetical protein